MEDSERADQAAKEAALWRNVRSTISNQLDKCQAADYEQEMVTNADSAWRKKKKFLKRGRNRRGFHIPFCQVTNLYTFMQS